MNSGATKPSARTRRQHEPALPSAPGGASAPRRPVNFTFNGKAYAGFEGDTLASALLANGVHFVARSFKYHRPRGILTAGVEEPNAIV